MPTTLRMLGVALAAGGLAAASLVLPTSSAQAFEGSLPWCSEEPAPCVESVVGVTTPGGPEVVVGPGDATYELLAFAFESEGAQSVDVAVRRVGQSDLGPDGLDDRWTVALDLGGVMVPRVTSGRGADVDVTRSKYAAGTAHRLVISGRPTSLAEGCNPNAPYVCPVRPSPGDNEFIGYFGGVVTDFGQWTDVGQRNASYGMDYWSNIEIGSVPPQFYGDGSGGGVVEIDAANVNQFRDGTPVTGFADLRLPNAFIESILGVPDPDRMTGSSLRAAVTGAGAERVEVYPESSGEAMRVALRGVTFPVVTGARAGVTRGRVLKVRAGFLVSRVTGLQARRVAPQKARVTYRAARNQGARPTDYRAVCRLQGGTHRARAAVKGRTSTRMTVPGLKPGRAYACRVRATSKAGPGRWSVKDAVPRRP